jgi:hypothetical protein
LTTGGKTGILLFMGFFIRRIRRRARSAKVPLRIAPVTLFLLVFASCASGPAKQTAPDYPILRFQKETPLLPEQGAESPRLRITLSFMDPDQEDPLRSLVWNTLYNGVGPEEYARTLTAYYEAQYAETGISIDARSRPSESMNWEYDEAILPEHRTPAVTVISRSREYYLGGAHGMREKAYFVFSPGEPKQLKISELIREGAGPELRRLTEDALRDYGKLKKGEPLSAGGFFEDSAAAPDNFFITSQGLGFHWDPYDIAPYAMGPIEVILSYEQIKGLLSPRGLSLFE